MREQYKSIVTADGWIICGKCGHKLARIAQGLGELSPNPTDTASGRREQIIEFKCNSCKSLNTYTGGQS